MKTNKDIHFKGHIYPYGFASDFLIPEGARVSSCEDSTNQFFLDDLSCVPTSSEKHDATHWGLRIHREDVGS